MRILYFPIHDPHYPRNRLIRARLQRAGHEVVAVDRNHAAFERAAWRDKIVACVRLFKESKTADIVVLSELSIQYAPITWIVARMHGARHVVDGFVGLYETQVEDWSKYGPESWAARRLRFQDGLAYRLADVFLVDTDARRSLWLERTRPRRAPQIVTVPVGAPHWARPSRPSPTVSYRFNLLFYGNFSPLHGLSTILRAVALARNDVPLVLRVIGDGPEREEYLSLCEELELSDVCEFVGRVPEEELADHISWSSAVLGIFGVSRKAENVIANKVWQGLAGGRPVITRRSPALGELRPIARDALVEVAPGEPEDLAHAIRYLSQNRVLAESDIDIRLRNYVEGRLDEFLGVIEKGFEGRESPS